MKRLNQQLKSARKRIRLAIAIRWSMAGMACGLLAGAAGIGFLGRWIPVFWEHTPVLIAVVTSLTGLLAGATASLLICLDDRTVALTLESHSDLKDRVSSAVWASGKGFSSEQALLEDASESLEKLELSRTIRVIRPHWMLAPVVSMLLLLFVVFLPNLPGLNSSEQRRANAEIRKHGVELEKVAERLKKEPAVDTTFQKEAAQQMKRLARQMQSGRMTEKETLLKLGKMEEMLRKQAAQIEQKWGLQNTHTITGAYAAARQDALQKQYNAAIDIAGSNKPIKPMPNPDSVPKGAKSDPASSEKRSTSAVSPEMAKKLAELFAQKDFQEAMKLLKEISRRIDANPEAASLNMSAAELEALAEALKKADMKELAKQLRQAAEALKKMNSEEAKKMLQSACKCCAQLSLSTGQCKSLEKSATACRIPSGTGNQHASTDREHKDGKGIGNPPAAPRDSKAVRFDKEWSKIYTGRRADVKTTPMKASSQIGKSGNAEQIEVEGASVPGERSTQHYYEVFPQYSKAAEQAIAREEVPQSMRPKVQRYFDSLR